MTWRKPCLKIRTILPITCAFVASLCGCAASETASASEAIETIVGTQSAYFPDGCTAIGKDGRTCEWDEPVYLFTAEAYRAIMLAE